VLREYSELQLLGYRLALACILTLGVLGIMGWLATHTCWILGPFPKLVPPKPFLIFVPQDIYPDGRLDLEDTAALYIQTPWNYVPSFPECELAEDALLLFPPDFELPQLTDPTIKE
jgi:hypothetical protein